MKYLKRLKKELAKRTKRVDWNVSSTQVNRALALGPLVRLVNAVRDIDHATEEWSKDNAEAWLTYIKRLQDWLAEMPTLPVEVKSKLLTKPVESKPPRT